MPNALKLPLTVKGLQHLLRAWGRITPSSRGTYRVARRIAAGTPPGLRCRWFDTPPAGQMKLDLDVYPDCCMAYGVYERETERVLRRYLRPGAHFVDVGANIGYFTLLAARLVGEGGQVDAFEPQPENRARLVEHLQRNRIGEQVCVHPVAASDSPGQATIHWFPDDPAMNHGCSTLLPPAGRASRSAIVQTDRLDRLMPEVHPALVKIDVEGSEPAVIRGMAGWLAQRPPVVLIEWSGRECSPERVNLLAAAVPAARWYVLNARRHPIDPTPGVMASLGQVNLLMVPPTLE